MSWASAAVIGYAYEKIMQDAKEAEEVNEHKLRDSISDVYTALLQLDSMAKTEEEREILNTLFDTTTRLARQMNWFYKKDKGVEDTPTNYRSI